MLSCFSHVRLCATPWTVAHQAPLSTEFSRQEYWSGLPFPPNISYYWSNILIVIVNYKILFKLRYLFKLPFMDFKGDQFSSVQSLSCVWLFVTPWIAAYQASLSITNSQSLLELMSIELVMALNSLILCHPLLLLPSIFPSIRVFSKESVICIQWPKYWSFSFSISPSNEYSGLVSFRIDWFDLLVIHGTLKNPLQHHSSKASILWRSAFFIVQLSYPSMTTGKTISLTRSQMIHLPMK